MVNGKVYFSGGPVQLRFYDPVSGAIEEIPTEISVVSIDVQVKIFMSPVTVMVFLMRFNATALYPG